MARSSAAVARANDSRCAATWLLARISRWRNGAGSSPWRAASEVIDRARKRTMRLTGVKLDVADIALDQCHAKRVETDLDRRQRGFEVGTCGGGLGGGRGCEHEPA